MKKLLFTCCCLLAMTRNSSAQDAKKDPLTFSGYAELYYTYDFNQPVNHTAPGFFYSHNRSEEITLNLGLLKASYNTDKVRANFALAGGTYINANYAAEPGVLKNIYEANAGVKISGKQNLWIDAGIFSSHIGFESAIGKDCWNLTRSILADNSPYFESGVKLSYTSTDEKWFLSALVLNGWQRIQRPDGNTTPAFGTQVTYKPSAQVTLNSSTFIGNDKPDSARQMRYFHNFYGIFQLNSKWAATLGLDIGAEQKTKRSSAMNTWYSPVVILKYAATGKLTFAARAEYYADKNGVIISTATPNGFKTWGFSANMDYQVAANMAWRTEVRALSSKDKIFTKNNRLINDDRFITTSLAISF